MSDLVVALVQTDIYWENIQANLSSLEEQIWTIDEHVDIIVLPEMFNTGFSIRPDKLSEVAGLHTERFLKRMANQKKAMLMGSYMVNEGGKYYNRFVAIDETGFKQKYDKQHLFELSDEKDKLTAGDSQVIFKYKGWKICPQICYDLRFPESSRNYLDDNNEPIFDVLIHCANWPSSRINAWQTLLAARSIENQCYCLAVNRTGDDPNGVAYNGQSVAYNFQGSELARLSSDEEILIIKLSKDELNANRSKYPFLIQN